MPFHETGYQLRGSAGSYSESQDLMKNMSSSDQIWVPFHEIGYQLRGFAGSYSESQDLMKNMRHR